MCKKATSPRSEFSSTSGVVLARKYRKLDAELDFDMDLNADRIARLSAFYTSETQNIEEEIQALESSNKSN
jgi:hypothetical protein